MFWLGGPFMDTSISSDRAIAREVPGVDNFGALARHWRWFFVSTVAVALFVVVGLGISWLLPAKSRQGTIEVTLVFPGASDDKLPNGAPFNVLEMASAAVVEPVWHSQGLDKDILLDDLLRSFTVIRGGSELRALSEKYQSKLSNTKLTVLEREAIETEWRAGIAALNSSAVRLTLSDSKNRLSDEQMKQFLSAIPKYWAEWSDIAGARTYEYPLPSGVELLASVQSVAADGKVSVAGELIKHFERMKDFTDTLALTLASLSKLPGSDAVRDSRRTSLIDLVQEVRAVSSHMVIPKYVEALAAAKARDPGGYQALRAVRRQMHDSQYKEAKERAVALKQVFDDFMEVTSSATTRVKSSDGQNNESQTGLIANVDGTFIDRVIDHAVLSRDMNFRRALTDKRLEAEMAVIDRIAACEFEDWLDQSTTERVELGAVQEPVKEQVREMSERLASLSDRVASIMNLLGQRNFNSAATSYRVDEEAMVFSTPAMSTKTALAAGFGLWALTMLLVGVLAVRSSQSAFERHRFSSDRLEASSQPTAQQVPTNTVTTQGTSTGPRA